MRIFQNFVLFAMFFQISNAYVPTPKEVRYNQDMIGIFRELHTMQK